MILPFIQGKLPDADFFLYAACDADYFDQFGTVLINSLHAHSDTCIHIHLFNPRQDQLDLLSSKRLVTVTHEFVGPELFASAAARLNKATLSDHEADQLRRSMTAMQKGQDRSLTERMQKTYYACARFVRLKDMIRPNQTVLAIDVDAVIRKPITALPNNCDFYIHRIEGNRARFLAGGIQFNPTSGSQQFIQQYAQELAKCLENDCIYWGLDQDLLENIASKYHYQMLPMTLIDWNMHRDSSIWTAKGTRKSLSVFVNESLKHKT
jgi:hypothetical protein